MKRKYLMAILCSLALLSAFGVQAQEPAKQGPPAYSLEGVPAQLTLCDVASGEVMGDFDHFLRSLGKKRLGIHRTWVLQLPDGVRIKHIECEVLPHSVKSHADGKMYTIPGEKAVRVYVYRHPDSGAWDELWHDTENKFGQPYADGVWDRMTK